MPTALSREQIEAQVILDAAELTDDEKAMLDAEFAALLEAIEIRNAESKRPQES